MLFTIRLILDLIVPIWYYISVRSKLLVLVYNIDPGVHFYGKTILDFMFILIILFIIIRVVLSLVPLDG